MLSENKFLNETKKHNRPPPFPFKLNGRSLINTKFVFDYTMQIHYHLTTSTMVSSQISFRLSLTTQSYARQYKYIDLILQPLSQFALGLH